MLMACLACKCSPQRGGPALHASAHHSALDSPRDSPGELIRGLPAASDLIWCVRACGRAAASTAGRAAGRGIHSAVADPGVVVGGRPPRSRSRRPLAHRQVSAADCTANCTTDCTADCTFSSAPLSPQRQDARLSDCLLISPPRSRSRRPPSPRSGKTLAYLLPAFASIVRDAAGLVLPVLTTLIMAPTRELAIQIEADRMTSNCL